MNAGNRERHITTDLLVIGGGMAGMFAAIKATKAAIVKRTPNLAR